ncbi:MAG: YaaC family protein [Alicyclobacillus sp.]|nr:YaaC family protein [Alicyclobacillus sp.]
METYHNANKTAQMYHNASHAAASIRVGYTYFKSAKTADLAVVPLLLYYALLNWLRGLLHIVDLKYPESTSVLQHGLSVRRSKRTIYRWAHDFVQVHREGVFPSFHKISTLSTSRAYHNLAHTEPQNRYVIGDLAGYLTFLHDALQWTYPQFIHTYPVISSHENGAQILLVSREIASKQQTTPDHWRHLFYRRARGGTLHGAMSAQSTQLLNGSQDALDPPGLLQIPVPDEAHPWVFRHQGDIFLSDSDPPATWLIHTILLFSLSALSRYNPLEWMDIVLWNNEPDSQLVRCYLEPLIQTNALERAVEDELSIFQTCGHL